MIAEPHTDISPALKARDGKGPSSDGDGDGAILVPMVAPCLRSNQRNNSDAGMEAQMLVAHSLRAEGFDASEDGTGRGTPLVPVAFDCKSSGQNGFGVGEIASTMRSMGHSGSHQNGGGHLAVAVALRGREGGATAELSEIPSALRASGGGGDKAHVLTAMQVRRLTPLECCRLQGFQDDYLDIIHRNKPAADGPKYKALGNGFAVPVMLWIGEMIQSAHGHEKILLPDGEPKE